MTARRPAKPKKAKARPKKRAKAAPRTQKDDRFAAIYAVVRRVPRGTVITYGQLAELAGMPGAARFAGAAMRACPERGVPWHRVVGRRSHTTARIAIEDETGAGVQRSILESEGVVVSESGGIALARFGWLPL